VSKKNLSLVFISLVILNGCATVGTVKKIGEEIKISSQPLPQWINIKPRGYFVGMSGDRKEEGEARDEALKNAQRLIIESLGVKVASKAIEEVITTGSTKDVLSSDVFSQAQIEVIGKNILKVTAEEYYTEKWQRTTFQGIEYFYKSWAKVRFSEEEHQEFIKNTVNKTLSLAKDFVKEGEELIKNEKYASGIDKFVISVNSLHSIEDFGVLPVELSGEIKKFATSLKEKILTFYSKIEIIPINEKITAIAGKGLEEPLKLKVFFKEDNKKKPIGNFPVKFKFIKGEGEIENIKTTDAQGIVLCNVYKISEKSQENVIEAMVGWSESSLIPSPRAKFIIQGMSPASKTKLVVSIEERILGKKSASSKVEHKIIAKLKEKNFSIISKKIENVSEEEAIQLAKNYGADILIYGSAEISRITKQAERLYSTRSRVIIKIFSLKDGKTLAVFDIPDKKFPDTRGFGLTEQEAAKDALSLRSAEDFFDYLVKKFEEIITIGL